MILGSRALGTPRELARPLLVALDPRGAVGADITSTDQGLLV